MVAGCDEVRERVAGRVGAGRVAETGSSACDARSGVGGAAEREDVRERVAGSFGAG